MLLNALASLGHKGIKTLRTFGRAGLMLFNALVGKPEFRKHAPLLVRQLYNVGVLSMLIIVVSGVFIGMVLGLQGYLVLTTYSAETSLGMLVALSLLRELGAGGCRVVVCRACWFGANRRNRPDARYRATLQYGDDGGGSAASGYFSPFLGWGYFITTVDGYFRRRGDLGRISGRRQLERH
ncbi:hypothetical protein VEE57_28200 [Escherichia coli]|nr:hypothetical protein VEE57_28200 [Escherichia coli]